MKGTILSVMRRETGVFRLGVRPLLLLLLAVAAAPSGAQDPSAESRETVLDGKAHVEESIIRDIPRIEPLCYSMDVKTHEVYIGGCVIHCEEEGEGTPLVLLHGGPGCTHHAFHPAFSGLKDSARIIYYDQRGCGKSQYEKGKGYSINQAVEDLDRLRENLCIEKWVVLGHSYGGTLAQCYTQAHPDRVMGLVLVASSNAGLPIRIDGTRQQDYISPEEAQRIKQIRGDDTLTMAQQVYNMQLNGDWKRQYFRRPTRDETARMALYEWKHADDFRTPMCMSLGMLEFGRAFDTCPIPTLIIEGKWDLTWTPDKPAKMQSCFPNADLVVFEQSGHSPFLDEPDRFNAVVRGFLEKASASTPNIAKWQQDLERNREALELSPERIIRTAGQGRGGSQRIASQYRPAWFSQLDDVGLAKLGFALYDVKRYKDALLAFEELEKDGQARGDQNDIAYALIWQGHMLDLLGRREEAVALYRKARDMDLHRRKNHDQYGLSYELSPEAERRLNKPFKRVENNRP